MNGYKRIDVCDAEAGDVFVFPADRPRLHASADTLARHGLSVGFTGRSDNSEGVVNRWFAETDGETLRTMASFVDAATDDGSVARGVNSLLALRGTRKVRLVRLARLDGDMLPTVEGGAVIGVPGLVASVQEAYASIAADRMETGLDRSPRYTKDAKPSRKWTALEAAVDAPFGKGSDAELLHAPHGTNDSSGWLTSQLQEERVLFRLFMASSSYDWRNLATDRANRVVVRNKTLAYLAKTGMEVWRPLPETWRKIAWKLLSRHAKVVLAECAGFDAAVGRFNAKYLDDLRQYRAFKALWKAAAKKAERRAR